MTETSTEQTLAARLATMIDDLQQHIEARAAEIAGPQIAAAEQEADRVIAEVRAAAAHQKRRHDDLETELRRQLDAAVKSRDREVGEVKQLRELRSRVIANLVTVATGPDGVRYAPYAELCAAVWPGESEGASDG